MQRQLLLICVSLNRLLLKRLVHLHPVEKVKNGHFSLGALIFVR